MIRMPLWGLLTLLLLTAKGAADVPLSEGGISVPAAKPYRFDPGLIALLKIKKGLTFLLVERILKERPSIIVPGLHGEYCSFYSRSGLAVDYRGGCVVRVRYSSR